MAAATASAPALQRPAACGNRRRANSSAVPDSSEDQQRESPRQGTDPPHDGVAPDRDQVSLRPVHDKLPREMPPISRWFAAPPTDWQHSITRHYRIVAIIARPCGSRLTLLCDGNRTKAPRPKALTRSAVASTGTRSRHTRCVDLEGPARGDAPPQHQADAVGWPAFEPRRVPSRCRRS